MGRFISMGRQQAAPTTRMATPLAVKPFPHAFGYYNADGSWHQQTVHLGRTQGGTPGLFTGHTLAYPISDSDYWAFSSDRRVLKAYAERIGFVLDPQVIED